MAFDQLTNSETVEKTITDLKTRNIDAEMVETKADALKRLKELLPDGAELNTASSTTLDQIGFTDLLISGDHPWQNWKDKILAEKNETKQIELRKQSLTSDYFIGSVHAVTEGGQILDASNTGSQLPGYTYASDNVIWVVGTQKIVPNLDEAFKRLHEYVVPLEDKRVQKAYGMPRTDVGKLLIFNRENNAHRKIRLIFVNEILGF